MAVNQTTSYSFDGTLADRFSVFVDSPNPSIAEQASGVLAFYTQGQPVGEVAATEVFKAQSVAPRYDQSWTTEITATVPATLTDTPKAYDTYVDGGLAVQFTAANGTTYSLTASLGLGDVTQGSRRYSSEYSITPAGGEGTEALDGQGDRNTTDISGRVGLRFDATTKVLTAYTQTQALLSIDLDAAGVTNWTMSDSDTFKVYLVLGTSGWSIPAEKKVTLDNFYFGLQSDPLLNGSDAAEDLYGSAGNDRIYALGGNDTIYGLGGNDWLDGGQGDDVLVGGDGNDVLLGAYGKDTLVGGAGQDIFGFYTLGDFVINDFSITEDSLYFSTAHTGLRTIADLAAVITSIEQAQDRVIIHFGQAASISLIGVNASDLNPGMVHFV